MHRQVLLGWLAGLFAVMAAVLVLAAAVVGWPVVLVAVPLAGMAALLWYHASGRLTRRLRSQARRRPRGARGPAATGPRGPRAEEVDQGRRGAGAARDRRRADATGARGDTRSRRRRATVPPGGGRGGGVPPGSGRSTGMSVERARSILGLGADPDAETVRAAYRRKVKEVHPDRGGDEETFKRVTEAYEALGGGT